VVGDHVETSTEQDGLCGNERFLALGDVFTRCVADGSSLFLEDIVLFEGFLDVISSKDVIERYLLAPCKKKQRGSTEYSN
jgi:hypothetical protein